MADRFRSWKRIIIASVLVLLFYVLAACADNGVPLHDLKGQIQSGIKKTVELVFDTRDPIVSLVDNRKGALYAATSTGEIYRISGVGKADRIYRGLGTCQTSWTSFAVTKDGGLVANVCRDNKDVIVQIGDDGEVKDLVTLSDHVLSLASDSTGKIYIATWTSEGNVSISLNPRSLAGAEYLKGKIFALETNGLLVQIFDGGIPVRIAVNKQDQLLASIWGKKGYFAPERKSYKYIDPYRAYWLALSDKIQLYNVSTQKARFNSTLIDSLTLFVMPEDDYLLGYGISADEVGGLYLVEENRPAIRLLFEDEQNEKNITALALFQNVVYFGNTEGAVYRIK